MANQPYDSNPTASEKSGSNRHPTIANLPAVLPPSAISSSPRPAASTHQCPNCGAWAPAGSSVCTECGTRLQQKPQKLRCRACGATASASLVICPHCGRELHAAPSRILSWGAPAVIVLLFLLIMVQRWESGNPIQWVEQQVSSGRDWVAQAAEALDPQLTISTMPVAVAERPATDLTANQANGLEFAASDNGAESALLAQPNSMGQESISQGNALPSTLANPAPVSASVVTATATVELATATVETLPTTAPTDIPTTAPTTEPTPTATAPAPTATATVVPPTATTVLATPTSVLRQPNNEAIVQATTTRTESADGVVSAAGRTAASATQTTTVTILQATATTIPSPTVPPTPTPIPTQPPATYTVRAGDTPLGIAEQFNIGVDALLAANGMSLGDARLLRVGQVLVVATSVPAPTPEPSATPTVTAMPVATTPAVVPTVTAAPTTESMRVDAPGLRSPETGSALSCTTANSLTWLPVSFIRESDQYLLHLGFLSGYNGDGSEQVTWILEQWRPANTTLWELDKSLCGLAPQSYGRQWRWYVQVVEADGTTWRPVSPPSAIWGFNWN